MVGCEIPLRRAIELIGERKSKIVSDVGQIREKPRKGVIFEKEALSELHKPPQTRRDEIWAKNPRRREISKKRSLRFCNPNSDVEDVKEAAVLRA